MPDNQGSKKRNYLLHALDKAECINIREMEASIDEVDSLNSNSQDKTFVELYESYTSLLKKYNKLKCLYLEQEVFPVEISTNCTSLTYLLTKDTLICLKNTMILKWSF